MHQLTDLPDSAAELASSQAANAHIREVGTANLLQAVAACGATRVVVQSIAWLVNGAQPPSVARLEQMAGAAGAVIVRYGQWYGPGTFYPDDPPIGPRIHIDTAARLTADALDRTPGTYLADDDGLVATP